MSSSLEYFHSIPYSDDKMTGHVSNRTYETSVRYEPATGLFVHRVDDMLRGGRVHEHYFSSLREFVIWHYQRYNYVCWADYPYEKEVKVVSGEVANLLLSPEKL
jgi:hypothetical protein